MQYSVININLVDIVILDTINCFSLSMFSGANIFLTESGSLKLGDFGCSVKLKNHNTMPGDLNTMKGTLGKEMILSYNTISLHFYFSVFLLLFCVSSID